MIRDLIVPYRRRMLRMILVMVLVTVPLAILAGISRLPAQLIGGISAFAAIISIVIFEERLGRRTLRTLTDRLDRDRVNDATELEPTVQDALTRYAATSIGHSAMGGHRRHLLGPLSVLMARHGAAGRAYRIAGVATDLGEPPVGFDVPFEPIPLNPRSEAFHALRGGRPTAREELHERWSMMSGQFGRSMTARILLFASMAIGVLAWIFIVYDVIASLVRGRTPLLFQHVLVIVPILALTIIVQLWKPVQWLVVPGAIIVRRSRWWSTESEVFMIRRDESVLTYWRDRHLLGIGDKDGIAFSTLVTPAMADVALRAWLSPLPPPDEHQLAELR